MVGTHLDQKVSPRVPRHVCRMLLDRSLLFRLRVTSGMRQVFALVVISHTSAVFLISS